MPSPPHLPPALRGQPFRLLDARRHGLSADSLRSGRFRRVLRSVYVGADVPDTLGLRLAAARLVLPESAVFSHQTAAQVMHLPIPGVGVPPLHVALPRHESRRAVAGVVTHQSPAVPARNFDGFPVTTPERTFLDLASQLSLVDLTILADAMVRRGFTTTEALADVTGSATGRRGIVLARKVAALARPRVDSPMETRVRLLIVLAGLPSPDPGSPVLDDDGQWVATVDLRYRAQRIAIEYDGELHHKLRGKWRRDLTTRDLLRELGWRVIVLTSEDIFHSPHLTLLRIRDALVARGDPGVPAELDHGWETHLLPRSLAA
ncbi:hypothetical protein ABN028_26975 [Actinopolymorpha sp. B17G11]|uniref:hypothetical protein n=1 Tax=Actinopolymorpha sp. B17G11 TaxID=3160861 RepID=UPI0032E3C2E1